MKEQCIVCGQDTKLSRSHEVLNMDGTVHNDTQAEYEEFVKRGRKAK